MFTRFSVFLSILTSLTLATFCEEVFVAERSNGNVMAIDLDTGSSRVAASGLGEMIGATFDRNGRLFVHRFADRAVALVNLEENSYIDIATNIDGHGLSAAPESDTLYLAGWSSGEVYQIEDNGGSWTTTVIADGLGHPIGSYRLGDDLFISDRHTGLYKLSLNSGVLELFTPLPSGGEIIDQESSGDLIVGTASEDIYRIDLETGNLLQTYTGFLNPAGIIVDPSDNRVIVCEHDGGRLLKLDLASDSRSLLSEGVETPWQPALLRRIDTDGDGVENQNDACPESRDVGQNVHIAGSDTGVSNLSLDDGCTLSDAIDILRSSARNHGQFISQLVALVKTLRTDKAITSKDAAALISSAAKSRR